MNVASFGFGQVRHTRHRPTRHAFAYANYFVWLPMHALHVSSARGGFKINRPGILSFYDQDHGDARAPEQGGAVQWLRELLEQHHIHDVNGEIWLQTYPRVWGYAFKPVSFWYCHRADGVLRAIVAEVNNTFGERHCYLLDSPQWGQDMKAIKCFHVSPFCEVSGHYRFRFMKTMRDDQTHVIARVELHDSQGVLITTSVSGQLHPMRAQTLRRAMAGYPALTLMVLIRIHWQALRLWLKKVPFFSKPPHPQHLVTQQTRSET